MNFKRRCDYLNVINCLRLEDLRNLREWMKDKPSEESREDKLELIDIVIAGKENLLRGAERLWL